MQLRDYQQEMVGRLHNAWTKSQSVMVQMPTGTGKTHVMAKVIHDHMGDGVLIVAHRIELIGQISNTLESFGIPHGFIDRWSKDLDGIIHANQVIVASIQTLSRRIESVGFEPATIIIDEAHHATAKTYRLLWEKWPKAKFLGLTATPCRLNNTGFTDLFDTMLQSWSIQEFIDKGWLSDFEYVSVTPDNWIVDRIKGLKKRGVDGDYQTKEMATVMDSPESIEHLYRSYKQYADGKKGIVYAINREHAQHISDYYQSKGVRCCWIEAMTPAEQRQQLVDDYRQGRMNVIVNVDIFSEGFDCPDVEFIQLARPTLSLSKYLQQVGRGMRVMPSKDYVVILDQVGMYQTFGMPTEERYWELMFQGKASGKGHRGGDHGYVIRNEAGELQLLNLEMVRIKRHGEKSTGVEIFMQNGRYGVMRDGKVSCPAEFEHVKRLKAPYFALAYYPYYIYKSRVTVIDEQGRDLKPGLYGNVRQEGDVFIGQDVKGTVTYWDAKGGRCYPSMPQFGRIFRFEVARTGKDIYIRNSAKGWEQSFSERNVYLSDHFTILGNVLFFNNDIHKSYRVCGYEKNYVYVYIEKNPISNYHYAYIGRTGAIVAYTPYLPANLSPYPNVRSLGLKRLIQET